MTAMGIRIIALTGRSDSTLARSADAVVCSGNVQEACLLGLAPDDQHIGFNGLG